MVPIFLRHPVFKNHQKIQSSLQLYQCSNAGVFNCCSTVFLWHRWWWSDIAVAHWSQSVKLTYVGSGWYRDGRPCPGSIPGAGHLFRYVTNQPPKANSAFHPSGVGKWVPASAGKTKAGMVHSVSGWTRGVQVKLRSLENACHIWAPSRCSRREAIQIHVYLYLYLETISDEFVIMVWHGIVW